MNKTKLFGDLTNAHTLAQIPVSQVFADPNQPRKHFNADKLQELADSIQNQGQIQPIVVKQNKNDQYTIIAGERRWRALQLTNIETVDCIIREVDAIANDVIGIVENMQRDDLQPIEEAQAIAKLIAEQALSQKEAGKLIGKNRQVINQLLKLTSLPEKVQTESLEINTPKTILVELSQLSDETVILDLWEKAKTGSLKVSEIRSYKHPLKIIKTANSNSSKDSSTEFLIRKGFKLAIDLENADLSKFDTTQLGSLKAFSKRICKAIDEHS